MKATKESEIEENVVGQTDFVQALRKINQSILDFELTYFKTWIEEYT